MSRVAIVVAYIVLLLACGSESTPQPSPCGTTMCTPQQTCVQPCINDFDCVPFQDAGDLCPPGYVAGSFCCSPPTPPARCVDDPHAKGVCADGQPDFATDGGFRGCMCTV